MKRDWDISMTSTINIMVSPLIQSWSSSSGVCTTRLEYFLKTLPNWFPQKWKRKDGVQVISCLFSKLKWYLPMSTGLQYFCPCLHQVITKITVYFISVEKKNEISEWETDSVPVTLASEEFIFLTNFWDSHGSNNWLFWELLFDTCSSFSKILKRRIYTHY